MRPFLMLIFSGILILVGRQSRTEDYDSASIRSPEPSLVEADKRSRKAECSTAFVTDKRAR